MPSKKTTKKPEATDWKSRMKESSHDVLLAGLAALARRKDGKKQPAKGDFETLVAEGRRLEPEIMESMQKAWTDLKDKSRASMDFKADGKLKNVFEERVTAALVRLGVPTGKEIQELSRKVDSLMAKRGAGKQAATKKFPAKPAVVKRTAAKKAPAKRAPVKQAMVSKVPAKRAVARKTAVEAAGSGETAA